MLSEVRRQHKVQSGNERKGKMKQSATILAFILMGMMFVSKLSHFLNYVNLGKIALEAVSEQWAELLLTSAFSPKMHFILKYP